ncbi:MAG: lysylphosphatidylglycerol synthase transmembrane domain-containing protein [Halomonas sp.]|uniref:lysylphosphatidylglycerol synthase transmembrane domain-containing protein n=1 Tax=Halomonas sp. TaxID=1486246 RepID=UPI002ACD4284|nr:lysylphosphatidylglycerol synthase transmembrane domain-containing protein [Halomonas sp.]MDZ7852673.1 lysylphosphatidylglycerol synthase transmembrane domain-containing protein [Halomonas sp.]
MLLPISVGISVVVALVSTGTSEILKLEAFSFWLFAAAAGLRLVPWMSKAFRLTNWMHFLGHRFSFGEGLRISIMSELGMALTPTAVGGQPVKAGMLYQRGVSLGEATSLTTIQTVEDLTLIIGLPLAPRLASLRAKAALGRVMEQEVMGTEGWLIAAGVLVAVVVAAVLLARAFDVFPKLRRRLRSFGDEFKRLYAEIIKRGKQRFALNVAVAAVHWVSRYSVVAMLTLSLGYEVSFLNFLVLQWVLFAIMAFVLISQLGVRRGCSYCCSPGSTGVGYDPHRLAFFGLLLHHDTCTGRAWPRTARGGGAGSAGRLRKEAACAERRRSRDSGCSSRHSLATVA